MVESNDLKRSLQDRDVSGSSPAALQHQGIQVLANSDEDSMGDLTSQQVTAFALLRAYNEMVPIPKTMAYINNYISLSRARDRKGRLEYGGCYKSYPTYVLPGGAANMPLSPDTEKKPGIVSRLLKRKNNDEK